MSNTPYKQRPADPAHAERGAALMAQWAAQDDDVIDLIAEVDRLGDYLEVHGAG